MTGALRAVYRYYALILFVAVIVQIFFAGLGIFRVISVTEDNGTVTDDLIEDKFDLHGALGFFLGPGFLLFFLIALGARLGRNRVLLSLAMPLLWILQELLMGLGTDTPFFGGLHAANALLMLGTIGYLAYNAWRRWTDLGPRAEMPVAT